MSEQTKIEWATSTGNPWIGCTKVSPGCKNCYAATLDANRFSRTMGGGTKDKPVSHWGPGAPRFRTKGFWKDAVRWNLEFAKASIGAQEAAANYHRPRIFPSLCDWLDEEVPIEWLADFLKLIHDTPNLDWLLLTKRPENFRERIAEGCNYEAITLIEKSNPMWAWLGDWLSGNPPNNVWLGVSVEDQQRADERIPELLKIPAKVRFLSVEPLLGPVELTRLWGLPCEHCGNSDGEVGRCFCGLPTKSGISWVIVGGESGPGARPCNVEWIRDVVEQCKAAGVPCFVKQLGAFVVTDEATPDAWPIGTELETNPACSEVALLKLKDRKGGDMAEWPEDLRVREFPTL